MNSNENDNNVFLKPTDEFRNYKALEEIEKNPSISQRDLAQKLGVALGIANACIHTLVKKGLIKIRGENNRGISYHLTKKGVLHKGVLAVEWTKNTINFYRETRLKILQDLEALKIIGIESIFLIGTEELTELVQLIAPTINIAIANSIIIGGAIDTEINTETIVNTYKNFDKDANCILLCGVSCGQVKTAEKELSLNIYKLFRLDTDDKNR